MPATGKSAPLNDSLAVATINPSAPQPLESINCPLQRLNRLKSSSRSWSVIMSVTVISKSTPSFEAVPKYYGHRKTVQKKLTRLFKRESLHINSPQACNIKCYTFKNETLFHF